ncbi:MAG: septum formation protein Maf [Oscillospiraceae bacterium]|nr:septum formation protein Maf [Oscillospiraceae bacterium]
MKFLLASASPRRKELFSLIAPSFDVIVPDIDEIFRKELGVGPAVAAIASDKARRAFDLSEDSNSPHFVPDRKIIVAADTVVVSEKSVLGKPSSEDDARAALKKLSGKVHSVITGVSLIAGDRGTIVSEDTFFEETFVEFFPLSSEEIERYIKTGEPFDKAGSYGIQGKGALLIKGISGDYFNVVGLPVARISRKISDIISGFEK